MWTLIISTLTAGLRSTWTALARLPRWVWWSLLVLAVLFGTRCYHQRAVATSFTRGYQAALDSAARIAPVYRDRVVYAKAKTDTVLWRIPGRIAAVDTFIQRVPDSIRVLVPVVDTVLRLSLIHI